MTDHVPIAPEPIDVNGTTAWHYPTRCADIDLAMESTRERIEEWDQYADPHGWWHERTHLIALYNEIVRLRGLLGQEAHSTRV